MIFVSVTLLFLGIVSQNDAKNFNEISAAELFTTKLEPTMFGWPPQEKAELFKYRPSLEGYPDLPSWMRYMYSTEHQTGYLYGTPPESLSGKEVRLDVVALNKLDYETRTITLRYVIKHKARAHNLVQMKIDNLNWTHLLDPGRVEDLKNIFRKDLWPESATDLHLVFMESAVKMGGRVPLTPQQMEGVIVHLGSNETFSMRLRELGEEVKPLYKLSSCTYKRTSVQKTFENVGFKLDWCAFHIVGDKQTPEVLHHNYGTKNGRGSEFGTLKRHSKWEGMSKSEVPMRNYIDEITFSIAIPCMILAVLSAILSAVLCFNHPKIDKISEFFFQNIFHICEDYLREQPTTPTVQMVQYSDTTNQPTTTLKSLKDPNLLIDNISLRSQSPPNSLYCGGESPRTGNSYLRPRPPPYKPPSIGKVCVDI